MHDIINSNISQQVKEGWNNKIRDSNSMIHREGDWAMCDTVPNTLVMVTQ